MSRRWWLTGAVVWSFAAGLVLLHLTQAAKAGGADLALLLQGVALTTADALWFTISVCAATREWIRHAQTRPRR